MIKKARASQKGVALLTAMVIIIIVAGMSAAFLMLSFNQRKFIAQASESEMTLHVAEAGVEDTINKLQAYALKWAVNKSTPSLGTNYDYAVFGTNTTSTSITLTGGVNGGTWSVTVVNNKGTAPVFPNPFSYTFPSYSDPIWWILTASGTRGENTRTLQVLTSAFDSKTTFKYGLFGDVEVDALGTFSSDGFDSKAGTVAYAATNSYTFPDGKTIAYAEATGNLGSNGNIVSNGNTKIMGNATPGPGGSTSGGGNIWGSTTPATAAETLSLPDVQYAGGAGFTSGTNAEWTSGSPTIGTAGTTSTDPAAVVHWKDMKPTGNGTLTIQQNMDIYIDGTIDMKNTQALKIGSDGSGNAYTVRIFHNGYYAPTTAPTNGGITINGQSIAGNASARNFQVYSTTTGDIKFNGGSTVYAAVNAPKAYFKNNGGNELFGSVIASKMLLSGNAYFHYDADLANLTTPEPKFKIVSWRETAH